MNAHLAMIAHRRELLVARAALQREALAIHTEGLRPFMWVGDGAMRIGRAARAHPVLVAVAALALWRSLRHSRRVLAWTTGAFTALELVQGVRARWMQARSERMHTSDQAPAA